MSQVNTELGLSATATITLNDSAVRALAGVSSGAISMNDLRGKSAGGTFSPDGGTSAGSPVALSAYASGNDTATVTITCTASASWSYTRSGTFGTPASGSQTATSLTFNLSNGTNLIRSSTWTVSATSGNNTRYWTVQLSHDGFL
jgi:hypothetical protein